MMTRFLVKYGACAPLRLSSIESRPATGITCMVLICGEPRSVSSSIMQYRLQVRALQINTLNLADNYNIAKDGHQCGDTDEDERIVERTGSGDEEADDGR